MADRNGSTRAYTEPPLPRLDPKIHDALCALYARVLVLDTEWRRLEILIAEIQRAGASPTERSVLERRHVELTGELGVLKARIEKLRAHADPERRLL